METLLLSPLSADGRKINSVLPLENNPVSFRLKLINFYFWFKIFLLCLAFSFLMTLSQLQQEALTALQHQVQGASVVRLSMWSSVGHIHASPEVQLITNGTFYPLMVNTVPAIASASRFTHSVPPGSLDLLVFCHHPQTPQEHKTSQPILPCHPGMCRVL